MRYAWIVALVVGCKGEPTPSVTTASGSAPVGSANTPDAMGSGSAPKPTLDAATPAASPDARCDEACLFLRDTPVDKLAEVYAKACGKDLDLFKRLETRDCRQLDYERNCIFAAHGFVFKQRKWQVFAKRAWFVPHEDWKPSELSPIEVANVQALRAQAKLCRRGITVPPADAARAKQWFASIAGGHPTLPALLYLNNTKVAKDELEQELLQAKLRLDRNTAISDGAYLEDAEADLPGKKLRGLSLSFSGQGPTGSSECYDPEIQLIFDEANDLVAVRVTPGDCG